MRRYKRAMEKAVRFLQLVRENQWTEEQAFYARHSIREQIPMTLHWVCMKSKARMADSVIALHYFHPHQGMFIPTIKGQGTDEQQAKWLPLAQTLQIVGTYAQVRQEARGSGPLRWSLFTSPGHSSLSLSRNADGARPWHVSPRSRDTRRIRSGNARVCLA